MTYAAELDDYPQAVRRAYASNSLKLWPKVAGVGNVTASAATYSLYRPNSDTELASGDCTITDVDSVSRLSVTVDASDTSVWTLDEYYRWVVDWTYSSVVYRDTVYFDCAVEVYQPRIGLNELLEEDSSVGRVLDRQALALAAARTEEQHASVLATKAWADVRQWLRHRVESDGQILPRLILDRETIDRIVIAQTLSRAYRAQGGSRDSEDSLRADYWRNEATNRLAGMGPVRYDLGQTGQGGVTISGWSVQRCGRSW